MLLAVFLTAGLWQLSAPRELRVTVLDVGQGDAIFISTPGGHQIVVDAGGDGSASRSLGRLMPFYDRTIDLVVLTHPHLDHYGGFDEIFERYRVKRLLVSGEAAPDPEYAEFEASIKRHGIATSVADHGYEIDFGDGVRLQTIYPNAKLPHGGDVNEVSIMVRVEYGVNSILLTGDSPEPAQRELLARERLRPVTVLKVAHHGSRDGLLSEFLAQTRPRWAAISVGERNTYGHPAPETLQKLEAAKVETYRTDRDGTVEFRSRAGELFSARTHALGD
jgi:competence protein ComEC